MDGKNRKLQSSYGMDDRSLGGAKKCYFGKALRRLGVVGAEVKKSEQLDCLSSLIIPRGESTTMAKLAEYHNLFPALREFVRLGKPVWRACAGLILLANKAYGQKDGGQ